MYGPEIICIPPALALEIHTQVLRPCGAIHKCRCHKISVLCISVKLVYKICIAGRFFPENLKAFCDVMRDY